MYEKCILLNGKTLVINTVGMVFDVGLNRYLIERSPDGNRVYPYVMIGDKKYDVHRLIAMAFLGKSDRWVLHENDMAILDCQLDTLRYGTPKDNQFDRYNPSEIRQLHKRLKFWD